jgi:palmitoyltransferase
MSSDSQEKKCGRVYLLIRYVKAKIYLCFAESLYLLCVGLDKFIRLLGAVMVLFAFSLFGFLTFTYFASVFARLELGRVLMPAGIFCLMNAMHNYVQTIRVGAGSPPMAQDAMEEGDALIARLAREGVIETCGKCGRLRPPRTHHCSICGVCYLKLDHHCPWTSFIQPNCVGFGNYRFFVLFLMYTCLVSGFGALNFGYAFFCIDGVNQDEGNTLLLWFAVCGMLFIAVGLLFSFHVYLVLHNLTTIESQGPKDKHAARARGETLGNPYDLGWRRNFQEVFGPYEIHQLTWALSWCAKPPQGDGMSFTTPVFTEITNQPRD